MTAERLAIPDVNDLPLLDAALAYAAAAWPIFPVWGTTPEGRCRCELAYVKPCLQADRPGKHPIGRTGIVPNGKDDATTDPATIERWWRTYPDAGIAIVPPPPYIGLDLDDLALWSTVGVRLPTGAWETTGREPAGEHHVVRLPDDEAAELGANHHLGDTGAEVKGNGAGYLIVAPTVHASGRRYRWQATGNVPDATPELLELLRAHAGPNGKGPGATGPYQVPEGPITEPGRYYAIRDYYASRRARGMTDAEIEAACRAVLLPRMSPPKSEQEFREDWAKATAKAEERLGPRGGEPVRLIDDSDRLPFPEPEDRGLATPTELGEVEYVEDVIRPGRIVTWAGEEGSGKTFGAEELGIRVAVAGGAFAGTWAVLRTGSVLCVSEMHPDDDYAREAIILESLGLDRSALAGRYYRLPLMTAAHGAPALMDDGWRSFITDWLREHEALVLIIDTATGATQVDPWGRDIQAVYRNLRVMLDAYPALAMVLLVHVRKPTGRGERRISDVLGEWGRWCDVVVMQENDGASLERTKITVRKRVRRERRIVATKSGGLLVDPVDVAGSGPKVPVDDVVAAIRSRPGIGYAELGTVLQVSKATAARYVATLGDRIHAFKSGQRGATRLFSADQDASPTASPPQTASRSSDAVSEAVRATEHSTNHLTASPTYIGEVVGDAVVTGSDQVQCRDFRAHQSYHRWTEAGFICDECDAEAGIRQAIEGLPA